ncbi:MAG: hypothetical protein ACJAVK_002858 [Akkermansiaceae bacterium]|jgi:hypothetical protein
MLGRVAIDAGLHRDTDLATNDSLSEGGNLFDEIAVENNLR